jgi:hypothetical protein
MWKLLCIAHIGHVGCAWERKGRQLAACHLGLYLNLRLRKSRRVSAYCQYVHFALGRCSVPSLDPGFVADDLAVDFVDQFVNGGIQIKVRGTRMQGIAFDLDAAFRALAALFLRCVVHRQQHFDVNDLVKVAQYALEFGDDIGPQGGAHFQMVAADGQVHGSTSCAFRYAKLLAAHQGVRVERLNAHSSLGDHYAPVALAAQRDFGVPCWDIRGLQTAAQNGRKMGCFC